jgi:hypothetical protein
VRRTAWLAITSIVLGLYAFQLKGLVVGPLTVATLRGLLDIGTYLLVPGPPVP